ncbi:hypothetical protein [Bacillus tropicus]|uniref:hypothetical protein n=1 Tax=Bacillus tropicus TaxID=2026188 RepID=UPI0018DE423C
MSNDNKLKLLQYLAFFPTIVCMMLLVDINAYPYACYFLEFEDTYEERKIFLTPKHKKNRAYTARFFDYY